MASHMHFPRVYLIRHGQTEWSQNGRHTGTSDIPLTEEGEKIMRDLGPQIVGDGKLLDPGIISHILVSPRSRANRTLEILFEREGLKSIEAKRQVTEDLAEWNYGDFEGVKSVDIRKDPKYEDWDLWTQGCPKGESPHDLEVRMDRIVSKVRQWHREAIEQAQGPGGGDEGKRRDVVLVGHGHSLRCFLARWINAPISAGKNFILDAGGISVGGYEHRQINEPAILGLNLYAL